MKLLTFFLLSLFFYTSCIPLRIAPNIEDYKVEVGKKFKGKLPNNYSFIFEDVKAANAFYNYMNVNYKSIENKALLNINDTEYFLSFYEVEIPTKYLNFIPFFVDAGLEAALNVSSDSEESEIEVTRIGHWYLVLTVVDTYLQDALHPKYENRDEVLNYLKSLKYGYENDLKSN